MKIPGTHAELTYCLNVHPGATLEELETAIFTNAKQVFKHFASLTDFPGPYGLGIWLSAASAQSLQDHDRLHDLKQRLLDHNFYVLTVNGFPYGTFHGTRVKEDVYRPDWADPERQAHTLRLAGILAELLTDREFGSISTVPVTYGAWAQPETILAATGHLAELAAALDQLQQETGKQIHIDLEPEPDCYLEDSETILQFHRNYAQTVGIEHLAELLAGDSQHASSVWQKHIGYCLDLIHLAVAFERPADALQRLAAENIPTPKIHLGAAVRSVASGPAPAGLAAFTDDTYLHQTRVRTEGGVKVFADLPDALAAGVSGDWRVHYHVPLTWEGTPTLASTRDGLDRSCFRTALQTGARHFEVETYTLGLFPDKTEPDEMILARELAWAWEQLLTAAQTLDLQP